MRVDIFIRHSALTWPETRPALLTGPRIGISKGRDHPWRFGLAGATGLSRPFPKT